MGNVSERLAEYERALRAARTEAYALSEQERGTAMQDRQKELDDMRVKLSASIASEKEAIQRQAEAARITLEADARRIAGEIGSRVLSRPITDVELN